MKYLILLLLCAPVAAQQCPVLVYNGAPFTAVSSSANNGLAITSPVTGLITLPAPLPMNATAYTVVPAAWDFTTQNSNLTSTNGWFAYFYYSTSFQFTTVNGVITDWKVHISWDNGPGTLDMYVIDVDSVAAGDAVYITFANVTSPGGPMNITGSSVIAGTWTCAPVNPLAAQVAQLITERNDLYASYVYWAERARALTIELNAALARK